MVTNTTQSYVTRRLSYKKNRVPTREPVLFFALVRQPDRLSAARPVQRGGATDDDDQPSSSSSSSSSSSTLLFFFQLFLVYFLEVLFFPFFLVFILRSLPPPRRVSSSSTWLKVRQPSSWSSSISPAVQKIAFQMNAAFVIATNPWHRCPLKIYASHV